MRWVIRPAGEIPSACVRDCPHHSADLRSFLVDTPKGADSHNHLGGAVYPESLDPCCRLRQGSVGSDGGSVETHERNVPSATYLVEVLASCSWTAFSLASSPVWTSASTPSPVPDSAPVSPLDRRGVQDSAGRLGEVCLRCRTQRS